VFDRVRSPHGDYDDLCDALEALKTSADQINENKKVVRAVCACARAHVLM
jgi:hypothetical protein